MTGSEYIQRLQAIPGAHCGNVGKLLKEADKTLASTNTTRLDDAVKTKLNTSKQQIEGKITKRNEVEKKIIIKFMRYEKHFVEVLES